MRNIKKTITILGIFLTAASCGMGDYYWDDTPSYMSEVEAVICLAEDGSIYVNSEPEVKVTVRVYSSNTKAGKTYAVSFALGHDEYSGIYYSPLPGEYKLTPTKKIQDFVISLPREPFDNYFNEHYTSYGVLRVETSGDAYLAHYKHYCFFETGSNYQIPSPFVNARYIIYPYSLSDLGSSAYPGGSGDSYKVEITKKSDSEYVMEGNWYNVSNLALLGTYDADENTLTFDGTIYMNEDKGSFFGKLFTYLDQSVPLGLGLYGGGTEGEDPLVLQCTTYSGVGIVVESIKSGAIDFSVFDGSSGSWQYVGIYGYTDKNCMIILDDVID